MKKGYWKQMLWLIYDLANIIELVPYTDNFYVFK
jgi:hypothetical protein